MKTMKNYHNLYLKCDVLSEADVFEKFRNNSLKNYGLCPSHYLRAPGLSWDTMFKMTKLSLNLFQILACLYFLRKVQEVEFILFLKDIAKPVIKIYNLMTQNKNQNILYT